MIAVCEAWAKDFYPRSPCGERQAAAKAQAKKKQISIHALLAESDGDLSEAVTLFDRDFYPRSPCGERLRQDSG